MLKIVHPTRAIDGQDYNRETADSQLVDLELRIKGAGGDWKVELCLPAYIAGKLRSHDWDKVGARMTLFADQKFPQAQLFGCPPRAWLYLLAVAARKAVYDCFVDAQVAAGNGAWAVPVKSIFGDQYPDAVV